MSRSARSLRGRTAQAGDAPEGAYGNQRRGPCPPSLFIVGVVTILGQVVLLREVLVASFGSELIYLVAIGLQMLGTAGGAMIDRQRRASLAWLFPLYALALPLLTVVARALRLIFRGTPGAYLPFVEQLAGVAIVVVPLGAIGGMLFMAAARSYVSEPSPGKALAKAYAIESAGGVVGGILSTAFIALGVQNFVAALVCGLIAAGFAAAGRGRTGRLATGAPIAVLLLLAIALSFAHRLDFALTRLNHPDLLASRDTPYGRATVTRAHGQVVVFENDALAAESQGTSAEELVHVAALEVRAPRQVLILGGVIEGLAAEVWKHAPAHVTEVEIDRWMVETASAHLPRQTSDRASPSLARTKLLFADPRRVLERPARYDLILAAMPEPDSGQASRFYTREFFEACARRLAPGGVLAFRLRSSENFWTPALARRTASITGALRGAFADVLVLPGSVNIVLASNRRLERDPAVLSRRFEQRAIEARLVSPPYLRYTLSNDRVAEIERILARTRAPASSDVRPVCYQYTLVLWLSRFFPRIAARGLPGGAGWPLWLAAAIFVALVLAARRAPALRRSLIAAFAGFGGMLLEGTLLLAYQMQRGVLYQDLGLLLTMFMVGLAAGSFAARRHVTRRAGVALLIAVAVLAAVAAWSVSAPSGFASGFALLRSAVLLFLAGGSTGALFAYAASQATSLAPLYAWDLIGGCAGALAGSLLLIPLYGLAGSALLVGGLAAVMVAAVR